MDSRRLVVWISAGILGFQGATLAFDLLTCAALSVRSFPVRELQMRSRPWSQKRSRSYPQAVRSLRLRQCSWRYGPLHNNEASAEPGVTICGAHRPP